MPRKTTTDEEIDRDLGETIAEGRELEGWVPADVKATKSTRAAYGLRLSAEEWRTFTVAAEQRDMTLSEFLRAAAMAAATGSLNLEQTSALADFRANLRQMEAQLDLLVPNGAATDTATRRRAVARPSE